MEPFFVCSDCGHRQPEGGTCAACHSDPMLDLRNPLVPTALLDDDHRRKDSRDRKVMWVAIVTSMVAVIGLSSVSKLVALLLASTPFLSGFILAMIAVALLIMKGFAVVFPFRPRFPFLKKP